MIKAEKYTGYIPSYTVARVLELDSLVPSQTTSSSTVVVEGDCLNLGVKLKFESKKVKVLGVL